MAKQTRGKDREEKARRRLTKAQLDLHSAQEKRAQAVTRSQAEIEAARKRGAAWVERATERVERRAGNLARAEAHLLSATAKRRDDSISKSPKHTDPATAPSASQPMTRPIEPLWGSSDAVDLSQHTASDSPQPLIVLPESVSEIVPDAPSGGNTGHSDSW